MSEPKAFASLGPTLLARKGGARPAMRPQLAPLSTIGSAPMPEATEHDLDDLGWNDMGALEAPEPASPTRLAALTPAPANPQAEAETDLAGPAAYADIGGAAPGEPEVLRRRRAAAAEVESRSAEPPIMPAAERLPAATGQSASSRPPAPRRNAIDAGRRAAFTLRLDAQRHLMLRLASTVKNRSAQQLVTAALDQFLAGIPEIESLASQVKRDRHDR